MTDISTITERLRQNEFAVDLLDKRFNNAAFREVVICIQQLRSMFKDADCLDKECLSLLYSSLMVLCMAYADMRTAESTVPAAGSLQIYDAMTELDHEFSSLLAGQ